MVRLTRELHEVCCTKYGTFMTWNIGSLMAGEVWEEARAAGESRARASDSIPELAPVRCPDLKP